MSEPRVERHVRVPLGDGTLLSADLWRPAGEDRLPAIVTYTPYRKDDMMGRAFEPTSRRFAEHGYVSAIVDARGLGSSEGIPLGVASTQEARDVADVVEWCAAQPWCDGRVGLWGMSWGGVNTLAAAALRPRGLVAIAAFMAYLDRYRDYGHPGGCEPCLTNLVWQGGHLLQQLIPPMHADSEEGLLEQWRTRLEHVPTYLHTIRAHPRDDAFWRERAVEGERIEAPALLLGGWRDVCSEGVLRAWERLAGPKRLVMGPWTHTMPADARVEPLDHVALLCEWWDRWLRDAPAPEPDPPVRAYVMGAGRWRTETQWPPAGTAERRWWLAADGRLEDAAPEGEGVEAHRPAAVVGAAGRRWDFLGLPEDQTDDDAHSLTYTTEPLERDVELAGRPRLLLHVGAAEAREVDLAVRLCAVADGRSELITSGWLRTRVPAAPATEPVALTLRGTCFRVPAGARLRLAVACSDFPFLWPVHGDAPLHLRHGGVDAAALELPLAPLDDAAATPVAPDAGDAAPPADEAGAKHRVRVAATPDGGVEASIADEATVATLAGDGELRIASRACASAEPGRMRQARAEWTAEARVRTPSGARVEVRAAVWSIGVEQLTMRGAVTLDGEPFFERTWTAPEPAEPAQAAAAPEPAAAEPRS